MGNRTSQENYTLKEIQSETCTDETVVEDVTLPNGKTKTVERKVTNCTTATTQVEKEKNTLVYNSNSLNQYTKLQNLNKNDEVKKEFTYEYDKNGNLVKDDINRYVYDYKNRLIKVIQNEVIKVDENNVIIEVIPEEEIVSFEYDVLNRRIEKITQEETIKYIYAGQQTIKEIITNNTTNKILEIRENIYSNQTDDILSTTITDHTKETPETNQYYYEKNHLGSITKITDEQGAIVEQYEYDVFGVAYASVNNVEAVTNAQNKKTLNIKKSNGSETANDGNTDELVIDSIRYKRYNGKGKIGNTRLYTGREYDSEIGLYYNRARYYNPDLGRFISRDPIDISDDVNLYAYVGNNGVMNTDPNGTIKKAIGNYIKNISNDPGGTILEMVDAYMNSEYNKKATDWVSQNIDNNTQLMINETELYGLVGLANAWKSIIGTSNENLGTNFQDFNVTAYMFNHSIFGNGESVHITDKDFIGKELKSTQFYNDAIRKAINKSENGTINYRTTNGIHIGESSDFENGFGTINYSITGKINSDGSIETNFSIVDEYKFYDLGDDKLFHNNIALISQENGLAVTPYMYYVDIYNVTK